jgi:hypothetical protein
MGIRYQGGGVEGHAKRSIEAADCTAIVENLIGHQNGDCGLGRT